MNFFEYRRYRKQVKHLRHAARHVRHMRGDVAAADDLVRLATAEERLTAAWATRDPAAVDAASEALNEAVNRVMPPRPASWLRENLEIIVVAGAVAMGVRTYFVQPFKIPTGSMQPTLFGITVQPQAGRGAMDYLPLNIVSFLLWGERYVEIHAPATGVFELNPAARSEDEAEIAVNGRTVSVPINFCRRLSQTAVDPNPEYFSVKPGDLVEQGQRLASGRLKLGDHVFVDKVRYNFCPPRRGNIIVFDTKTLKYPGVRTDSFYIKRLVGLPGETLALEPPYLVADGKKVEQPYPFWRLLHDADFLKTRWSLFKAAHPEVQMPDWSPEIGCGYRLPDRPDAFLFNAPAGRTLQADEFLPMGDNTFSSLDGRYFGPLRLTELVGPAFMIYWPLSPRWGWSR